MQMVKPAMSVGECNIVSVVARVLEKNLLEMKKDRCCFSEVLYEELHV